ncbi:MAG: type II/IV secretion system ATPase subunit [Acidilobus sp.]|jgi:flagellar protein FlaI
MSGLLSKLKEAFHAVSEEEHSKGALALPLEEQSSPPSWTVVSRYNIGPVEYILYRGGDGTPRLMVREPERIETDRLLYISAGIDKPADERESYLAEKYRSGYGKIYPLMIDPHIEEISYSGSLSNVVVIHKQVPSRWVMTDIKLTEEEANGIAIELARKAGKSVSIASPYAEGLTAEGHRVSVSFMREMSRFGSSFVIRKYPQKPFTIADLLSSKAIDPLAAAYLWLIEEAQGFIIIEGAMGAGKTTVLQSLISLLPPYSKVVTIEDTPELVVVGPIWDSLVTRPRTPGQEVEEITLEDLLKFTLRRRADYVIVGEVRGREGRLLAQAAASGYGAMTTLHSDSPQGAIMRLTMEPISLPPLFLESVKSIVQVKSLRAFGGRASRRVNEVAEMDGDRTVTIYRYGETSIGDLVDRGRELEWAAEKLGISDIRGEVESRVKFLESLAGRPPDELRAELSKFYVTRYGDII